MLDAVVDYLPSPLDVPPVIGEHPVTHVELLRTADDGEPFSALVFKIAADPYVGKLAYFRVYSGTLKAGSYVLNATKGKKERIGRILEMHANHREEIEEVYAGDIAAAVGLKETYTGDTLSDPDHPVVLESIVFPEPVIEVAIEPKTKADQDKLALALQRLAEEDPTFRVHTDEESGQTRIAGMGELHLDVLVDRMVREFKVAANVGRPRVSYRETIRGHAEGVGRHVKQTGGKGQYGHAVIKVEPNEPGKGYEFVDKIVGGTIPREYIKPIDQGIRETLETGPFAGYPMIDVKVTLFDGSFHEVDSSEMAFKIAGSLAIKDAVAQCQSGHPRAADAGRGDDAGSVHGRRHRRSQRPARAHRGDGGARLHSGGAGASSAGHDVRLRHGPAVDDPGPRQLFHGVVPLRRGPRQRGGRARSQIEGLVQPVS